MLGSPGGSGGKESACSAGDLGSIPGLGRFPGEGNGNPPQHSCLENSMDRETWWATVHGVTKSQTRLRDVTSLKMSLSHRCQIFYSIASCIMQTWTQLIPVNHLASSEKQKSLAH